MTNFKFSGRAMAFTAAALLAVGLTMAAPTQAQAASRTGNFLGGLAAGVGGTLLLQGIAKNRRAAPRYYDRRTYYARPAPWSDAWYDYCGRKYRSFNPRTGYYRAYSGRLRFCR